MSPAIAIAKREIRSYFNSPVAYIVVTVFLLIAGFLYFQELFTLKQADLRGYFNLAPILFTFIAPAMTMRLLAEERGTGSLELLITMPVRDWEVVLGKFLAALTLLAVMIGLTLVYALTVSSLGPLDRGPTIGGFLGLLLLGGAFLAIGVMASAFTRNQIVSFIFAFAVSFALVLIGRITPFLPEGVQGVTTFLSLVEHFDNISRGVIDSRDVLYYLSVMGICLLVATTALESRRWK